MDGDDAALAAMLTIPTSALRAALDRQAAQLRHRTYVTFREDEAELPRTLVGDDNELILLGFPSADDAADFAHSGGLGVPRLLLRPARQLLTTLLADPNLVALLLVDGPPVPHAQLQPVTRIERSRLCATCLHRALTELAHAGRSRDAGIHANFVAWLVDQGATGPLVAVAALLGWSQVQSRAAPPPTLAAQLAGRSIAEATALTSKARNEYQAWARMQR